MEVSKIDLKAWPKPKLRKILRENGWTLSEVKEMPFNHMVDLVFATLQEEGKAAA